MVGVNESLSTLVRTSKFKQDHSGGFIGSERPIGIVFLSESDGLPKRSHLIQWSSNQDFSSGRLTDIDSANHVKAIVAARGRSPIINVVERQGTIILVDTQVRIVKAAWKRNQNISLVPDWMLRLMDIWDLSVAPEHPQLRSIKVQRKCSVCHDEFTKVAQPERAVHCCLCLMPFHTRCCHTDILPLMQAAFAGTRSLSSSLP